LPIIIVSNPSKKSEKQYKFKTGYKGMSREDF